MVSLQFGEGFGGSMVMTSFFVPPPLSGSGLFWAAMLESISGMTCSKDSHWLGTLYGCCKFEKVVAECVMMSLKIVTKSVTTIIPCSFKHGVLARCSFALSCWGIICGRSAGNSWRSCRSILLFQFLFYVWVFFSGGRGTCFGKFCLKTKSYF